MGRGESPGSSIHDENSPTRSCRVPRRRRPDDRQEATWCDVVLFREMGAVPYIETALGGRAARPTATEVRPHVSPGRWRACVVLPRLQLFKERAHDFRRGMNSTGSETLRIGGFGVSLPVGTGGAEPPIEGKRLLRVGPLCLRVQVLSLTEESHDCTRGKPSLSPKRPLSLRGYGSLLYPHQPSARPGWEPEVGIRRSLAPNCTKASSSRSPATAMPRRRRGWSSR